MSQEITVTFRNAEEAGRCDLTRVGLIAGGSEDGLAVVLEPDIDGWDGVRDDVRTEILRSGLAACGVFAEVRPGRTTSQVVLSPVVVEARAEDHPCELYAYHSPKPSRTQGHHRHPVYLQNRVYGRIQDGELLWVCGTCHDNIHEWLGWLLGEAREPSPHPGRLAKAEAQRAFDWYEAERAAA